MDAKAQFVLDPSNIVEQEMSLHDYTSIADVGDKVLTLQQVRENIPHLVFKPLTDPKSNLGFTQNNYWLKCEIENKNTEQVIYYLETARPITDVVDLYMVDSQGKVTMQKSGDNIPFVNRAFDHRKTIFKLFFKPGEKVQLYIHLKSDGEVINLPVKLHSFESLLKSTYFEQLIFGVFYGILALACITYMFLFFALGDRTFLYYSLYVIFIALMQFSLDGYFYQYITPDGAWFSQHAVIIFATISGIFLGKYGETFLQIQKYNTSIYNSFRLLYILLSILLVAVLFIPSSMLIAYPLANAFGLAILILIVSSLISIYRKNIPIDKFFTTGIFFLVAGFVIFILNNFSILPNSFLTENSPKLGTGMEIIFLSLSMANRIRILKTEKENMQALALQRSEEMNEVKSFFLSNMSHELRTPLNAIMNLADLTFRETDDPKVKNNSEVIKHASYNLLSSVNDILDFSKMEKGELKLDEVNFEPAKIIDQIKSNAEIEAQEKGLDFKFSLPENMPAIIMGDAMRLGQIVNNVLNNAIKYTNTGFVKFSIDSLIKEKNKVSLIITISDSGIGIPKQKIDTIFEPFTQETINNKRKYGGFGLGLCIVKALVDLHEGDIELSSTIDKGTVCRIILDYKLPIAKKVSNNIPATEIYDLKGKQILIIEDNPINVLVLQSITNKWKNVVTNFASNGLEGLEVVRNKKVDLILMDLHMPEMDGYEATIAIRSGKAGAENTQIPIIAITADVMENTKERVMEIGMNDYISKPIDRDVLYHRIYSLIFENQ